MRGLMGRVYLMLVFALSLGSCEFTRERSQSILLIAVEGLSFNALNCDSEDLESSNEEALRVFCEESVRFTHAFTPSTMSQATLASLFTGLYPFDHQVRTNGGDFLSARFRTIPEVASTRRYHTLLVSGGAPIWRKSGLAQGFEIFDDSWDLSASSPYRPAAEVARLGISWLEQSRDGRPFFATLFFADLQFPDQPTSTQAGDVREKGISSQVAEVMESLGDLIKYLKKNKMWDRTHVVLLGLNSLDHALSDSDPTPLSLRSDSTQVALFIKPARKVGGSAQSWTVDRNVTLVDLSRTLFDWLGEEPPSTSIEELAPHSLAASLEKAEPDWNEERLILSESAWADWLEGSGIRWAVRKKQFLYIHDKRALIYNTLTDRLENLPIRSSDPLWNSLNGDVMAMIKKAQVPPFRGLSLFWQENLRVAQELWVQNDIRPKIKGSEPWVKWYLFSALNQGRWKDVKKLAQDLGDPVGVYVASRHLGESRPHPRNPCLRMALSKKEPSKSEQAECEDEKIVALNTWRTAAQEDDRLMAQEKFLRLYALSQFDQDLGRLNYLRQLRWDVDREWPYGPSAVDYLLTLKEFEPFAKKLAGFRGGKDGSL